MKRKRIVAVLSPMVAAGLALALLFAFVTIGSRPQTASANPKPNIVVILVDDLD